MPRVSQLPPTTDPELLLSVAAGQSARAPIAAVRGYRSVREFGAVGDGLTDDAAAFAAASAACAAIFVPQGVYLIESAVDIEDEQRWLFDNATLTHTDDTKTILRANGKSGFDVAGQLLLLGTRITPAVAAEIGLEIQDCTQYTVSGVCAQMFKGAGFALSGATAPTLRATGQFANCRAISNTVGATIAAGSGAEYTTWLGFVAAGNRDGVEVGAGNTGFFGGSISENTRYGVRLVAGGNHGHGMFAGVSINHNAVYNVVAEQVVNGYTFSGCHFYGNGSSSGALFFDRCAGIEILGGHLDCWVYNDKDGASAQNRARAVYCPGSYGDVVLSGGPNAGPEEFVFIDCFGPGAYSSGVTINSAATASASVARAAGSTSALTSGVPATLTFPAAIVDRAGIHNGSTGAFTVPAGQAGLYRISAHVMVSGTALNSASSYIDVQVNGASRFLSMPVAYGTGKLCFPIFVTELLADGDVVSLSAVLVGTSPVHGDSTWRSTASLERIA